MKNHPAFSIKSCALFFLLAVNFSASASISLDRTRAVFNATEKSISMSVSNDNAKLPYLAQAWVEDENGKKINEPLLALPPIQRIDAGNKSQVRIQLLGDVSKLPQNRETLFYFSLREIPPKPEKANALQVALQTRIKIFYRPKELIVKKKEAFGFEKVTLKLSSKEAVIVNPTPYHLTVVSVNNVNGTEVSGFKPLMVKPFAETSLGVASEKLPAQMDLLYINDFGGRTVIPFACKVKDACTFSARKK